MAHFAKIDPDTNLVLTVLVVSDSNCIKNGVEQESLGQSFLQNSANWPAANWIKTSHNTKLNQYYNNDGTLAEDQSKVFRGNFAEIGGEWDPVNQIFWPNKPFDSWVKNFSKATWEAPVGAKPAYTTEQKNSTTHDYFYSWNESTTSWDLQETPKQPSLTTEQEAAGQWYDYNPDNNSWELQTP